MGKRFSALLLTLAVVLTLLMVPASAVDAADSGQCGDDLTWTLAADGTLTISGSGAMYDYDDASPWSESEPAVTSVIIEPGCTAIGVAAFAGCLDLEQVSIPATVSSIRGTAFLYCMSLSSVVIPDGITEIEDLTFYYCSSLPAVSIPDGVTRIGADAFACCEHLASVSIPNTVTQLGAEAFANCPALTAVTIPGSVTEIGENAFSNCSGLTDLRFSDGVPTIGAWAFVDCNGLTSLSFPDSVREIGDAAFINCKNLAEVSFPENLSRIGEWAFSGCALTDLTIPDSVEEIGTAAFQECTSLTGAALPEGLPVIQGQTFYGCSKLASVDIPGSVTTIESSAFSGCSKLADVNFSGSEGTWNRIDIESGNNPLLNAAIHCRRLPLEITAQPEDYVGAKGSTASFRIVASGDSLTYKWQISDNGGESWSKSSVTADTYSTTLSAARNGRMIRCIVTDEYGDFVTSEPASMRISGVAITQQPQDYLGAVNSTASFTVSAAGDGLTYQWQISDNGGAKWSKSSVTEPVYTTKLSAARDGRLVRCIVTDAYGNSVTSDSASMQIEQQPLTITQQPENYVGKVNSTASFTVIAEGEGLTYQWQISDNGGAKWSKSSVKEPVYTTKLSASRDGRLVRCIVTDSAGNSVTSEAASMQIEQQPLTITQQPENYVGKVNSTASFMVAAEGEGLTYQWQISTNGGTKWTNSSVTGPVYSSKLTAARDGRMLRCIVTDSAGNSVTSDAASMKIG